VAMKPPVAPENESIKGPFYCSKALSKRAVS